MVEIVTPSNASYFSSFLISNKDLITLLLAILGALGTLWTALQNIRKVDCQIRYFGYNKRKRLVLAYIQFENRSRLPISINDVSLVLDNTPYPCTKLPKRVSYDEHRHGKEISVTDFYNIPFPINLSGLAGSSGYLLFEVPLTDDIPLSKPQTFLISTNRGRALKLSRLPDRVYYGE